MRARQARFEPIRSTENILLVVASILRFKAHAVQMPSVVAELEQEGKPLKFRGLRIHRCQRMCVPFAAQAKPFKGTIRYSALNRGRRGPGPVPGALRDANRILAPSLMV
jgi:hypothetical protein